jgi:hypothetical protein
LLVLQSMSTPASAAMQSAFDLQPAAHVVPVQYWPVGQLSPVGKHCTHALVAVLHLGVGAAQVESSMQATHVPWKHTLPGLFTQSALLPQPEGASGVASWREAASIAASTAASWGSGASLVESCGVPSTISRPASGSEP